MSRRPRAGLPSMDTYERDPGVDAYLDALPDWQRELCQQLRDLAHAADPEVREVVKRRVQPYFVLDGNVCALLATKDHVNLFVYDGAIVPDPHGLVTGGHDNTTARTIAFWEGDPGRRAGAPRVPAPDHRQQPRGRLARDQEGLNDRPCIRDGSERAEVRRDVDRVQLQHLERHQRRGPPRSWRRARRGRPRRHGGHAPSSPP